MRARNIKPGFFGNEEIAELPPETRLLFIGLWLMADREGRLEDRPRRIKMHVFPADSYDVDPMLTSLHNAGLIVRYEVAGENYIEIPKFLEHQRPHHQEKQSVIPPAPKLRTKERTASHQGTSQSALNPDTGYLNTLPTVEGARAKKKSSRRCPPDFKVTEDLRAWALENFPNVDLNAETAAFRDHEFKQAHSDWPATWRNWIRKSKTFGGSQRGQATDTYHDELRRAVSARNE